MAYCVYEIIFENNKRYIGKATDFNNRMKQHSNNSKCKARSDYNSPKYRAMRKYKYESCILMEFNTEDEAYNYETIIIRNHRDLGYELYNLDDGGRGGIARVVSDETRKKLSEKLKGNKGGKGAPIGNTYGKARKDSGFGVIQYDKDMNEICQYNNINEASKKTNIHHSNIYRAVSGNRKTAGGYIWKKL